MRRNVKLLYDVMADTIGYLTIIPRARMGSESMSASWAIDSEAMRARGIIVLVKSN